MNATIESNIAPGTMPLKVTYKASYGRVLYYPACTKAKALAGLMGTKTFTPEAMKVITQALGAEVTVSFPDMPGFEAPLVTVS